MPALTPPVCDFGWQAPDFRLPATDGKTYTLDDCMGPNGLLVMFICNHCPYVISIADKLSEDCKKLRAKGVHAAAIMSNDTVAYPDDSFEKMVLFAKHYDFDFPYLLDESQGIARTYGAVCTPDFFGFNTQKKLQFRGRFDSSGRNAQPDAERELLAAMLQVGETGNGPEKQISSIGCSLKWKA